MDSHEVNFEYNARRNKAQREKETLKADVASKVQSMSMSSNDKTTLKEILDDMMEKLI